MKSDSNWRRLRKSVMKRFGLETPEQAEELLAQGEGLWRSFDQIDVKGRRHIAQWFVDCRKEEQEHFRRLFQKHFAEQSKRRTNRIERAIWWIATKPWIRSATGYTRAYHVAGSIEDGDALIRRFNDAAEVIDQHYGKGFFGLRLEWGFVDRDGEDVKAICVREWPGGKWLILLDYLAATNQTLTRKPPMPLSEEERAIRRKVAQSMQGVVREPAARRPGEDADLYAADPRINYRPDAPPAPSLESYGPEDWKLMSDFLFMIQIPEKDFEHQAKAYDGWWNKKGRKKVAFQNIRSRIAPFS